MKEETVALFENFCRTCMIEIKENQSGNKKFISIFNRLDFLECRSIEIMDLLLLTVPKLNIDSKDKLPKNICENCLESLAVVYKFQTMCVTTEKSFWLKIHKAFHRESKIIEDPLKDVVEDVSELNVGSHITKDLVIKTENKLDDEVAIDNNEFHLYSNTETNDKQFEISFDGLQNTTSSENIIQGPDNEEKFANKKGINKTSETIHDSKMFNNTKQEENNKFCCDTCGIQLKTRKNLMRHKKIHLKNSKDVKEYERSPQFHIKNDENKMFMCDECGSRFSFKRNLKRHKLIHLRPAVERKKNPLIKTSKECKFCKKVFLHLEDHLKTHTGERPYLCTECGKAFKTGSSMREHLLRHGTDRRYVCPDCPKKFLCPSDLAAHKVTHNKKLLSHVCDICGAAFRKPSAVKQHKMYHTGEKKYKCEICEMRFVLAEHCRRHMRTHTGAKPYKCKYCEKAYAQTNDLIKHLRVHLGDNVYTCDACPQKFRLLMELRAHFSSHKNDDEETKERNFRALKEEEQRLQMKFDFVNST